MKNRGRIYSVILVLLMFVGACAGSTSGGFKCIRAVMTLKTLRNNFRQILHLFDGESGDSLRQEPTS